MKNDGRLRRNWLKGTDGDAFHALLYGCGHNLRMILPKQRLLLVLITAGAMAPFPVEWTWRRLQHGHC